MKKRLIKNILSLIVLIVILFTTYEIFKLNVLPNKYLILFIVGEANAARVIERTLLACSFLARKGVAHVGEARVAQRADEARDGCVRDAGKAGDFHCREG